jgi:hypothetical protein
MSWEDMIWQQNAYKRLKTPDGIGSEREEQHSKCRIITGWLLSDHDLAMGRGFDYEIEHDRITVWRASMAS